MTARKVLILFAHPALERSRINLPLMAAVQNLPGITFNDLYQCYPDLDIDVRREQQLLLEHEIVVMQHPFYWYSTPAILKEWQDLVLEHGWAYGHEGNALHGKVLVNVLTAGGGEQTYQGNGSNRHTIREFLLPLDQTATLCGMLYLPPLVVYGTHAMDEAAITRAAAGYRFLVEALRDDLLDTVAARHRESLNGSLDALMRKTAES